MQLYFSIALALSVGNQICGLSLPSNNTLDLHVCVNRKTVSIQVLTRPSGDPSVRDDYINAPGVGFYKLHTEEKSWNEARKVCRKENAHLAIINSKAEEAVSSMYYASIDFVAY